MTIGVTGHQDIGDEDAITWVKNELKNLLEKYKVTKGYSSLANGTDQLFAAEIINLVIPLVSVIPSENYENTFEKDDLQSYYELLNKSSDIVTLPFDHPSEEAFFEAGKWITDRVDLMIAVWNGKPAKGLGGTADIVDYAQQHNKKIIHINNIYKETKTI